MSAIGLIGAAAAWDADQSIGANRVSVNLGSQGQPLSLLVTRQPKVPETVLAVVVVEVVPHLSVLHLALDNLGASQYQAEGVPLTPLVHKAGASVASPVTLGVRSRLAQGDFPVECLVAEVDVANQRQHNETAYA